MNTAHYIFSKIPSIQEIDLFLESQGLKHGREVRNLVQALLFEIRQEIDWLSSEKTTRAIILERVKNKLEQSKRDLITLINGTGAIIHTNLGRSVFSHEMIQSITEIATSYSNLEFSLESGKRGVRLSNIGNLLKTLTGAEEAVIVNNNASAVLLVLATYAKDQEVVISRGELVEIGGSFRIPDIIGVSGAILREVGTTNRTRIRDYERALSDKTALLLKVHTSNYQILGFTETVSTAKLAGLGRKENKIVMEDLGSGALVNFNQKQLNSEPIVTQVLKDGVDIVTFSGDKLLGGPQAGIILGKKRYLDPILQHPLYRALRCGKLTMALLEKTLLAYSKNQQNSLIPTQRMLNESEKIVRKRAESVTSELNETIFKIEKCESMPGGGSLPGKTLASWGVLVLIPHWSEDKTLKYLRLSQPPVIGRIQDGNVIIDCRTVLPHQIEGLKSVLLKLSSDSGGSEK